MDDNPLPIEHTYGELELAEPDNRAVAIDALRELALDTNVDPQARLRAAELLLSL